MEEITSASGSTVKGLVLLRQKASKRRQSQSFLIEGERLVLDTPKEYLEKIYLTRKAWERIGETLQKRGLEERTILFSEEAMAKAADTKAPQGVLAVARQPKHTMEDLLQSRGLEPPLLLLLEDIQDPGNLGTMFRSAEAAGVNGIIMSKGTADVFNPKVVRSTMSALFRMPFIYVPDLTETMRQLRQRRIALYAACLEGSVPYTEADFRPAAGILIGNEGNGLTEAVQELADGRIRIPMAGQIESLNAAISAGILMYEAARQRGFAAADNALC